MNTKAKAQNVLDINDATEILAFASTKVYQFDKTVREVTVEPFSIIGINIVGAGIGLKTFNDSDAQKFSIVESFHKSKNEYRITADNRNSHDVDVIVTAVTVS